MYTQNCDKLFTYETALLVYWMNNKPFCVQGTSFQWFLIRDYCNVYECIFIYQMPNSKKQRTFKQS